MTVMYFIYKGFLTLLNAQCQKGICLGLQLYFDIIGR